MKCEVVVDVADVADVADVVPVDHHHEATTKEKEYNKCLTLTSR